MIWLFIVHGGGTRALAPADYCRLLGQAWYRAGRELGRGGGLLEARERYRAALAWNRWDYKTWRRMSWAWFKTGMFFRIDSATAREPIKFGRLSAAFVRGVFRCLRGGAAGGVRRSTLGSDHSNAAARVWRAGFRRRLCLAPVGGKVSAAPRRDVSPHAQLVNSRGPRLHGRTAIENH